MALTPEQQLRVEGWQVLEPEYLARLAQLTDDHRAAAAMRIGWLLVEANRVIPRRFDPATGDVQLGRLPDQEVGDVIDDLAETVLRTGGEVVIVPADRMPADHRRGGDVPPPASRHL